MGSPTTSAAAAAPAAGATPAAPVPADADADDQVDFLDAVVDLDAQWYEEGRQEGAAAGRARGREEGKAVGKAKGFEIGCELGFYHGCAATWLEAIRRWNDDRGGEGAAEAGEEAAAAIETETDAAPPAEHVERATRTLEGILQQVADFPRHNAPDEDLVDRLQRLRAKFRAAASLVGVSVAFTLRRSSGPRGEGGGGGVDGAGAGLEEGLSF